MGPYSAYRGARQESNIDTLISLAQRFFLESVYGSVIIALGVYALAKVAKKAVPRLPNPENLAIATFVICGLTLPSIPMYQFEKQTLATVEGKDWIRVTNITRTSDILTPITLINTPIHSLTAISPEMIQQDTYHRVQFTFDEEPMVAMLTVWCSDKEIWISEPDWEGNLRYTDRRPMRKEEIETFCESDWSKEKDALYAEFKKQNPGGPPTTQLP